ncbi:MAG: NIPSNAP family protein [Proteobacteria bacterium]|nr:NIPSNAP family protein [Pseudomonadota bacterium]
MIYRMRTYRASRDRLASSHRVFFEQVLPVHQKHGARLVGRWQGDDGRIVVIWEYDSRADCERIQRAVQEDPDSAATAELRRSSGLFGAESEEVLMVPTEPSAAPGAEA